MIWGFTGTRKGMSRSQFKELAFLFELLRPSVFVHGDCLGADAEAHHLALNAGIPIHIRPCTLRDQRAFCTGATHLWPVKKPLPRNRDIVRQCDVLIGAPSGTVEELRSGTWSTIRFARKIGRCLTILTRESR